MIKIATNPEYAAFARRIVRAAGKRIAQGDPTSLGICIQLQADLATALETGVTGLRANGFTWQEIGEAWASQPRRLGADSSTSKRRVNYEPTQAAKPGRTENKMPYIEHQDFETDEITRIPAFWEICQGCQGEGARVHSALSVWTGSDRDEDPEGFYDMMRGRYDVKCEECKGLGRVKSIDRDAAKSYCPEALKDYEDKLRCLEEMRRDMMAEMRMGA